jgi:hypothetical protein
VTTRRKSTKRKPVKRTNSNVAAAQKATSDARKARAEKERASSEQGKQAPAPKNKPLQTGLPATKLEARSGPMVNSGKGVDQGSVAKRDNTAGQSMADAAQRIAGLALPMAQQGQQAQRAAQRKLADTSLYGQSDAKRAQNLSERSAAAADTRRQQILSQKGQAVWMGTTKKQVQIRNRGPERFDENGGTTSSQTVEISDVKTKDELMSWLADEKTFNEIKKRMTDSGIAVQNYDDVAKLWGSVIDQAAATYSLSGKKVTPWALLSLRGKNLVNGRPAAKTTTSTNIDEMDPAQAKVMIKNTLSQMLGRDPKKEEIEDFIAKAQTIARQNPQITKTTTQYDFAGDPTSQTSVSSGGGDAVTAKAQLAAEQQAKQSEDYAAYQGAGVYMPWLMDALSSPV